MCVNWAGCSLQVKLYQIINTRFHSNTNELCDVAHKTINYVNLYYSSVDWKYSQEIKSRDKLLLRRIENTVVVNFKYCVVILRLRSQYFVKQLQILEVLKDTPYYRLVLLYIV